VESPEGEMAFLREVKFISIAVHKNILRLIGFCTTPTERLLVYPFMENLSVASRLRGNDKLRQSLYHCISQLCLFKWSLFSYVSLLPVSRSTCCNR
jgi:hypothetical protein